MLCDSHFHSITKGSGIKRLNVHMFKHW